MASEIDTDALALFVRRKIARSANLRDAAKDAGVSPATLSRVQRGHVPDTDSLIALTRWLDLPIERVMRNPPLRDASGDVPTPDKVEVHLRADPKLSPATAARLAEMFRAVYEEFTDSERKDLGADIP